MRIQSETISDTMLKRSVAAARRNWIDWSDVFEHRGSVASNPIFAEPGTRFGSFCKEYSVHRTVRAGRQNEFRRTLIKRLPKVMRDDTGSDLGKLGDELFPRFGTHDPPRRVISILSKVAAFVRPERFVAWDQYARKGLNLILGRGKNTSFESYTDYLHAFDSIWSGQPGRRVRKRLISNYARGAFEKEDRFLRRVFDVFLMKCGGRKI